MARWLIKEEPTHYNFADFERDGTTDWDGVRNPLARKYLRQVKKGDRFLYYHTGKERAIVGQAVAVTDARETGSEGGASGVTVRLRAASRLTHPVTLESVKADADLQDWELVRLGRLSVMPVTDTQWERVLELSRQGP
jgi:predicted RNA-binding protein with PUA-like domain